MTTVRSHGKRLSISFLHNGTANTLYILIDRGGTRTVSSTVFDYALTAGGSVSFNLLTHGPDTTSGFQLLASASTISVGVGETFSADAVNV